MSDTFDLSESQKAAFGLLAAIKRDLANGVRYIDDQGLEVPDEMTILRMVAAQQGYTTDETNKVERVSFEQMYAEVTAPLLARYAEIHELIEYERKRWSEDGADAGSV